MIFPGDCFELPQVLEHVSLGTEKAVFIPGIFLGGGGGRIPPKKLTVPQTAAKLCEIVNRSIFSKSV